MASSGVESARMMGTRNNRRRTVTETAKMENRETALPTRRPSSSSLFAPTARAIRTVGPTESPTVTTVSMCIT